MVERGCIIILFDDVPVYLLPFSLVSVTGVASMGLLQCLIALGTLFEFVRYDVDLEQR